MEHLHLQIQPHTTAPVAVEVHFGKLIEGISARLDIDSARLLHRELGRILERNAVQLRPRHEGLRLRAQQLVERGVVSRREYEAAMGQPYPGEQVAPGVPDALPHYPGDVVKVRMAGANETPAPNELEEDSTAWFQRVMGLE